MRHVSSTVIHGQHQSGLDCHLEPWLCGKLPRWEVRLLSKHLIQQHMAWVIQLTWALELLVACMRADESCASWRPVLSPLDHWQCCMPAALHASSRTSE